MGGWTYISPLLSASNSAAAQYAGRPARREPSVGSKAWHDRQQKEVG